MSDDEQQQAGRALDAEVARRVFDWVWAEMVYVSPDSTPTRWLMSRAAMDRGNLVRTDVRLADDDTPNAPNWDCMLPPYSTSIEAAWAVVEEMHRQDRYHGFCWRLWHLLGYREDDDVNTALDWLVLAQTAGDLARLICVAALGALDNPSVLDCGGAARMNAELRDAARE